MSETKEVSTKLANVGNAYLPMIQRQLEGNAINFSEYARHCVLMGISAINAALAKEGIDWNDPKLDQSNLTTVLLNIATLQLNAAAQPREVYFIVRSTKDKMGSWKKQIEMGVEGDGNDALLRRFGVDIEEVCQHWVVREDDKFVYPRYKGLELSPPEWEPGGKGPVKLIVYPIKRNSGRIEYHITDRDSALPNLLAHISNSMMNETFGLAKTRYDATEKQKAEIDTRKKELMAKGVKLGWDALDDPELAAYISPAWREPHSRESMIIRKMRNNIVKKLPKDFGSHFILETYARLDSDAREVREEIEAHANGDVIEIEPAETGTPAGEPDTSAKPVPEESTPDVDPATGEIKGAAQTTMSPGF